MYSRLITVTPPGAGTTATSPRYRLPFTTTNDPRMTGRAMNGGGRTPVVEPSRRDARRPPRSGSMIHCSPPSPCSRVLSPLLSYSFHSPLAERVTRGTPAASAIRTTCELSTSPGSSGAFTSSIRSGGSDSGATRGGTVSRSAEGGSFAGVRARPPQAVRAIATAATTALRTRLAHGVVEALERGIHFRIPVRGGHEGSLERRGRDVHTSFARRMEEAAKEADVASLRAGEVAHRLTLEEESEHRARVCRGEGHAVSRGARDEPGHEPCRARLDAAVQRGRECAQRCQPGCHREWIAGQCTGLVYGPLRGDHLHELAPAAVRGERQAATDHLAERREIRRHAIALTRA